MGMVQLLRSVLELPRFALEAEGPSAGTRGARAPVYRVAGQEVLRLESRA